MERVRDFKTKRRCAMTDAFGAGYRASVASGWIFGSSVDGDAGLIGRQFGGLLSPQSQEITSSCDLAVSRSVSANTRNPFAVPGDSYCTVVGHDVPLRVALRRDSQLVLASSFSLSPPAEGPL
ncbi:uncharacterized protein MYCFIDRAFT_209261 [Pseudocercospora fijiensis CIRAD86]|uniref:Uncharacterized protein n=1 Tax=Pseudocercospora fijiensis (strain CIRAD86) TaxID=383855 RepID=M3ALR7_PSEFD|nr:uncharacterized protein MYCFIDRAFT_209261 [Pseudocercospora fijiensis CIRAD86]EME78093.1 hypothetical protein MYCFIDRAFT_209261 [Pseudocercospora fijiensis CIRAD86]